MSMKKQTWKAAVSAAAVCVAAALPSWAEKISVPAEYTVISYIQSTGEQFIDTGVKTDANTSLFADFMLTGYAANDADVLFGTSWSWNAWNLRLYNYQFQWFGENVNQGAIVQNTRLLLDVKTDGTILFRNHSDGSTRYKKTGQDVTNTKNVSLRLLGYDDDQSSKRRCTARLYRCIMTTNNITARDFIPVKRVSDSKVGLYDQVSGEFFTNASSNGAAFTAGTPVPADAWWKGGLNGDKAAAANWTCKDVNGDVMADAVPGDFTTVHFGGSFAVQSPRGASLPCARVAFEDGATLAADCDWRGLGERVDFAGHLAPGGRELRVATLTGTAKFGPHSGYDYLEYIESSQAQSIKTGIVPSTDTALELTFRQPKTYGTTGEGSAGRVLFGTGTWGGGHWNLRVYNNQIQWFGANTGNDLGNQTAAKTLTISIKTDKSITLYDANTGAVFYGPHANLSLANTGNGELSLFGYSDGNRLSAVRIYGCKIWKNGALVRNFRPARRISDDVLGLWDGESNAFYTNCIAGAAAFGAGASLETDDDVGGTVRLEVPEGVTVRNSSLVMRGGVRFVKEGAGTFDSVVSIQSYLGGTSISNGLLKASTIHSLGGASDVHVAPNGVIDMRGNNMNEYTFVLDGGAVSNTVGVGATTIQLKKMRLTADSTYHTTASYGFCALDFMPTLLDLGGHTLSAYIGSGQYFTLVNTTVTNGTIRMMTGGHIRPYNVSPHTTSVDMSTVDLEMFNCAFRVDADMSVHDYVSRYEGNYNFGSGDLAVCGTFTPTTKYYYGCTLQDGATLDISQWPAELGWPMYSRFTYEESGRTLKFADGANVTVNLAGRADVKALAKDRTYLLKWGDTTGTLTQKPVNVTFTLDATSALHYRLKSDDTGLLLSAPRGFVLIVK